MKTCRTCGKTKDESEFSKKRAVCKKCRCIKAKIEYREDLPTKKCIKCGVEKSVADFTRRHGQVFRNTCLECDNIRKMDGRKYRRELDKDSPAHYLTNGTEDNGIWQRRLRGHVFHRTQY